MYEAFFGLLQRPFAAVPAVQNYFPAEVVEQSRLALIRTIERAEGAGLVIGPAGTGKTLLCQMLVEHFRGQYSVVMLNSARLCTRRALLQSILFELRLPFREMEEGELRLSLIDHLEPSDRCPHGMLLLIDEGHTLPLRILEEVRLITNLVRDGAPRVRLVLSGNAQLEERLASPRLESFNQRIATRCYLHAMSQHETRHYVQHQVRLAGGKAETIFADEAYRALYLATDGVPRLINQVCDHVMMLAYAGGRRSIDARGVEEAWADLQRLPAPWSSDSKSVEGIIEFGHLDDGGEEVAAQSSFAIDDQDVLRSEPALEVPTMLAAGSAEIEIHYADFPSQTSSDNDTLHHALGDIELSASDTDAVPAAIPQIVAVAKDPFGGAFADEEVVLDRFHSWDDTPLPRMTRVSSAESHEIAAALATRAAKATNSTSSTTRDYEPERTIAADIAALCNAADEMLITQVQTITPEVADGINPLNSQIIQQPALEDLLGTPIECWSAGEDRLPARPIAGPTNEKYHHLESDDRDIIVVEDQHAPHLSITSGSARATRQEYRRLFGQLRRS